MLCRGEGMSARLLDRHKCRALALNGDWFGVLSAAGNHDHLRDVVAAGLWRVRALRALGRGKEANVDLQKTAETPFEATADELTELGEELVQAACYEAAACILGKLKGVSGAEPRVNYLSVLLWREREVWGSCFKSLDALERGPEPWKSLSVLQRAWAYLRQDRSGLAYDLLLPWSMDDHPGVQKLWARLELHQRKYADAVSRLRRLAQRQPLDWEWPGLLATALAQSPGADTEEIQGLYAKALSRQPRQPDLLVNRARLWLSLGDLDAARRDTQASLDLKPWLDAPVLLWVEHALQRHDFAMAHELLQKARALCDTARRGGAALDLMRMESKRSGHELAEAARALRKQYPADAGAQRTAGAALQAAGFQDEAARSYARALELNPEDAATSNNLAMLCRDRGDIEEALSVWQSVMDQADDTVKLNYAISLLQRGDIFDARRIIDEVLNRVPDNPVARRGMAELMLSVGDEDAALAHAQRSIELAPTSPRAWIVLARVMDEREGRAQSVTLLRRATGSAKPVLPVYQALFKAIRGYHRPADVLSEVGAWCSASEEDLQLFLMAADAAHDCNDFAASERWLKEAMRVDFSRGGRALVRFLMSHERDAEAISHARQLTRREPDKVSHWGLLAEVWYRQGQSRRALDALERGLRDEPTRLALVRQKVGILLATERFDEAVRSAEALVHAQAKLPQISLWVEALERARKSEQAVAAVVGQLARRPADRALIQLYARTLERAGQLGESADQLAELWARQCGNLQVAEQYVRVLVSLERYSDALSILHKTIEHAGSSVGLVVAAAHLMLEQGELTEAREALHHALQSHTNHLPILLQLARLEQKAGELERERQIWAKLMDRYPPSRWANQLAPRLSCLDLVGEVQSALNGWRQADPGSVAPWWTALAVAKALKRPSVALELLQKIEQRQGEDARILSERADLYQDSWKLTEAHVAIRRAIALRPANIKFRQMLFNILVKSGDFGEIDDLLARMEKLLGDRRYAYYSGLFFNINCHPDWSARQIWRFYRDWFERSVRPALRPLRPHHNDRDPHRRLRVGYVSPDFRRHAVAYFSEPLLCGHDREQFELFAYAHLEPGQADDYTDRFRSYVDHWVDITHMSDVELDRTIREQGIDILVDLAGHTSNGRLSVFVQKPAPIQVSYLIGAGQTTGIPLVDYLVTDNFAIPKSFVGYCAETIANPPFAGLPYRPPDEAPSVVGLPMQRNGFVTFGVLARPLRTNDRTISAWAEILKRVDGARLCFDHVPYMESQVQQHFVDRFTAQGVDRERLIFRNTRPHWEGYSQIDLMLDPFPSGSGTVATEALYMGRLVMSLLSRPPMGRIGGSQLMALGVEDFCLAENVDEYIEKTVALVGQPELLKALSLGLRDRMRTSRMMDYPAYGRDVAGLYRDMWMRYCRQDASM